MWETTELSVSSQGLFFGYFLINCFYKVNTGSTFITLKVSSAKRHTHLLIEFSAVV
jgi:hypothetical protein